MEKKINHKEILDNLLGQIFVSIEIGLGAAGLVENIDGTLHIATHKLNDLDQEEFAHYVSIFKLLHAIIEPHKEYIITTRKNNYESFNKLIKNIDDTLEKSGFNDFIEEEKVWNNRYNK